MTATRLNPAAIAQADVINSAAPVEMELLGVHPRMLASQSSFDALSARLDRTPWKDWLPELVRQGDAQLARPLPPKLMGTSFRDFDIRGLGEQMIQMAFLYRLTGEEKWRAHLDELMRRLTEEKDWGHSLVYGHWARGFAFALDWLWHDFDADTRARHVETLYARTKHVFDQFASYRSGEPFGYTWNISAVVLGGVTASAACLYGERPDIAPIMNLAWEKARMQSLALGDSGVSPEGIMYGGYYAGYLLVSFLLIETAMGFDLYESTPWIAAHPRALHAQTVARDWWTSDGTFFRQGDMHGHVFGQEGILRIIATRLQDTTAQWFANEFLKSGNMGPSPFSFLLYDPEVKAIAPTDRPPFEHVADFGIVTMRSDWSGKEASCAIKCGPNIGHHAARLFTHPLGGGHMHPNNGELQIFAHGQWILEHPGYVWKDTSYHNTLLIDGKGQYGENSEWFEDLPCRQRRRHPFMARAEHHDSWDYCIADMTEAYPAELGLTTLRRHILYLRPSMWIVLDAVEGTRPVTPAALFHTGFPVAADEAGDFRGTREEASVLIRFHAPGNAVAQTLEQERLDSFHKPDGTMHLLRMQPRGAAMRHLLITEIQVFATGGMAMCAEVAVTEGETVRITCDGVTLNLTPFGDQAPHVG